MVTQKEMYATQDIMSSHLFSEQLVQFRVAGGLEAIPAVTVQMVGYTLDSLLVYCRANTERNTNIAVDVSMQYFTTN